MSIPSLIEFFSNITQQNTEEKKEVSYVIYARKSTEGEDRQVRSLSDQVLECQEYAQKLGLKVFKTPLLESESAKESDTRPIFKQMLSDIKAGKYQGILAWHPDRLARNMKEAGEIIDLLDKGIIADLKFANFSFENTSHGKVSLGITFVLAKEYSDRLSENVRRGIKRSIAEGKYPSMRKDGYYKDSEQYLRPDGENFLLIKAAFQMRLDGKTLEEIARYLNDHGYQAFTSVRGHYIFKMSPKKLSKIFTDPVYAGVLVHGDATSSLKENYDFVPVISEIDFLKINQGDKKLPFRLKNRHSAPHKIKADFLRGLVTCWYCKRKMSSSITNKHSKRGKITSYYYYRCDTKGCEKKGKSIRAKVVIKFLENWFNEADFSNPQIYSYFTKEMGRVIKEQSKLSELEINKMELEMQRLNQSIQKTKDYIISQKDISIKDTFEADLRVKLQRVSEMSEALKLKKKLNQRQKNSVISASEFLELFQKIGLEITKGTDLRRKDFLAKKIFLNLTIRDGKIASYTLNPPFKGFQEQGFFFTGRGAGTRTLDLMVPNHAR